ncbi:MAG TPA: NUDIX hydrolase [Terriglobia bacterium]|nr:NUDIX hydrolase [Terriglobia bacterium]
MVKREFPRQPILCVGAVVIRGDSILLIRRGKHPQMGEWTLPGGMVELGESVHSAVRREVWEETGLRVKPASLAAIFERIIRRNGRVQYHYIVLDYVCRLKSGKLRPASDVTDARWVSRAELGQYCLRRQARQVIQKAFDNIKI